MKGKVITLKSDLKIAQEAPIKPISEIAEIIGLTEDDLELYGKYKAKVTLDILERNKDKPNGKYIDVTCITPTPLGEGKTVTTIGLSQALNKIGKKAITCIRQPSLGPVFGIKGGAAGGGYSQVIPMEDFNLHLTGDVHAVGIAHNLLAAFMDTSILKGNKLNINPFSITLNRVVDISDRAMRKIVIGLGGRANGVPRETGYDITVASEVMAILALTNGLFDLRERLGRMVIGSNYDGEPVTAEDLKCAGAMTVLLKDAIKPNLLQTLEHTPCFVHTGPFANIAHGNSSVLADLMAIKLGDYVVTESGFGADCGAEKFMNIKCRVSGLIPDAVVIVTTVRAMKMHGGAFTFRPGAKPPTAEIEKPNPDAVAKGCENLVKQIENVLIHGVPAVVCVNKFDSDTDEEIEIIKEKALAAGAEDAVLSNVWRYGGKGGEDLARAVVKAAEKPNNFKFLYPLDISIKEKIETIATKIYGAAGVDYAPLANRKIDLYTKQGFDKLPLCMAKTHLSLSHDPKLLGRPTGYILPIRDINASVGSGFLYPLCGEMRTMPGLPSIPAGTKVDIDEDGNTVGLF
ncbi:MAG: formate--tetrahydrofolate ligase [Actinobacteria bacterium]|nr:formate--tetrahydrofolate ligase [Actinomycetota bacterium]